MRIIIQGDFYDCQLIRGRLFLWNTYGELFVMDIRQEVKDLYERYGKNFEYTVHKDIVGKFVVSSLRIKGGIFPLDSAYMGDHLYTATESGLYKRYLQDGVKISDFSKGKAKKLIDIRFMELSAKPNMMAMAGASEGVFELYNPRVYRVTKSGHQAKEVEKGIYSVMRTYSKSVWYERQNIASESDNGKLFLYRYRTGNQLDEGGKRLRNYIRQESLQVNYMPILPAGNGVEDGKLIAMPVPDENPQLSKRVYVYKTENMYSFSMFADSEFAAIAGKPRRFLFGEFGIAAETKNELVIIKTDQKVLRINGPITRARVVSGFGKKNNLIAAVCSDYVLISDCEDFNG